MIDLSLLKPYILNEPDNTYLTNAINTITVNGFDTWFVNQIDKWCNCKILSKDGKRLLQTNDKRYNYEVTTIYYLIDKYCNKDKDYYYNVLLERHNENLEFEAINGFEYDPYSTTKKKPTTSKKKTKQTSLDFEDKPKKETVAERKLKAHAAKISMLTFKIKPANGNNTL